MTCKACANDWPLLEAQVEHVSGHCSNCSESVCQYQCPACGVRSKVGPEALVELRGGTRVGHAVVGEAL